ncbi:MAG: DNA topoisomerase IV subunit A [Micavibrio sp.]|mgnify:CR=1 FL=1|nr:DNA topoisomerase IV subunit A [Micavibrio sp.]
MVKSSLTAETIDQPLTEILSERYLSYALSTIMSRSLPDVRDGLKPVHRRLLYAMYELSLKPENAPKKCARVVGDVIGKFHPHGDQSVYDALVRLAQDFAVRYPLINGQGNFGNIDGDNAAAMRYTEAKLTDVAAALLEGIEENAIDFRATYDGETMEPIVLPSAFPNLLANGSQGIAVGMATSIPPHNVDEICGGLLLMLDKDPSTAELLKKIPGPDFPTGGILVEDPANIKTAYETGRGSFRLRARWEVEKLNQGQYQIIVTEIPYQVQKSRLIEKIADLITTKKIPMLEDVRDESAEDIRLVLVPKNRNVEPELLMEALFRHSDLENRVSLNMNVLDNGIKPRVMPLKDVLRAFLNHLQEVLVRRSAHRLDKVEARLEILEGYKIVYLNLDEVIRIVREEDYPKEELIKAFNLTENQAEAILNMRLRSLRKLEEMEIRNEIDKLSAERQELKTLLASEAAQWARVKEQVTGIKEKFGKTHPVGKRRTDLGEVPTPVDIDSLQEAMIEKEPITVICSEKGWIRAMKGHNVVEDDVKYKEGDRGKFVFTASTTDKILIFATNGRFYTVAANDLPSGRGFGEPLRLMVDLPNDSDIVEMFVYEETGKALIASEAGYGFIVNFSDVLAQTKNGKQVLNLSDAQEAALCKPIVAGHDSVAVIGQNRKLLIFCIEELSEMSRGKGVILQKYKDGGIADLKTFTMAEGLSYKYGSGDRVMQQDELLPWIGKRAQAGRMPPNGFPRNNKFD